ncbi:hypothetical protein BT69DRAFT_1281890 [Atractiella rhizophila]|nr:hypothetical protein BT69DRAFT_1288134 [Atractiella rhizophila]KAH8922884.1 hypothetical protein BT69DRAFT_1281890 [Atractiella rhizophila]
MRPLRPPLILTGSRPPFTSPPPLQSHKAPALAPPPISTTPINSPTDKKQDILQCPTSPPSLRRNPSINKDK